MTNGVKISILILWAFLFVLLLQRDYFINTLDMRKARIIKQAKEESFLGVYFREERIGYVKYRFVEAALQTTYRLHSGPAISL